LAFVYTYWSDDEKSSDQMALGVRVKRVGIENVAKFHFDFLGEDLPGF